MAYDPELGAIVLFGGQDSYGNPLGDTWEFVQHHWKDLNLSGAKAPRARWGPGLIYDPAVRGILLFGGQSGYLSDCPTHFRCFFNDAWVYNATGRHRPALTVAPEVQSGATLVYDTHDGYVFLRGTPAASPGHQEEWKVQAGK
jgi:hypothetical protein